MNGAVCDRVTMQSSCSNLSPTLPATTNVVRRRPDRLRLGVGHAGEVVRRGDPGAEQGHAGRSGDGRAGAKNDVLFHARATSECHGNVRSYARSLRADRVNRYRMCVCVIIGGASGYARGCVDLFELLFFGRRGFVRGRLGFPAGGAGGGVT